MIDFHNHVLPNLDDGSKSMEQSISMLKTAEEQGISDVICTVHYQHPKMDGKKIDYEIICAAIDDVHSVIRREGLQIKLHAGSEVFYLPNLIKIKNDPLTTFGHGKYMLIEFQNHQFPPDFDRHLYDLAISGTTPVIAHPERYKLVQKDIAIMEKLIYSGCLMQIDAGSIIGHFGKKCRQISINMLKKNMVHFIGSDAHNDSIRNFCLKKATQECQRILGKNVEDLVNKNPQCILSGEKIEEYEIIETKEDGLFKKIIDKITN